jgi:hypothetical protein
VGALASLIAGLATGETLAAIRRARRAVIAYVIAGTLASFGIIYLLIAGTIWASRRYGAIEASLAIGVGFLVLALIVFLIHKFTSHARVKAVSRQRNRDLTNAAIAAGIAAAPALLRGKAGLTALLLPAVAVVAYAIYRENSNSDPTDPPAES